MTWGGRQMGAGRRLACRHCGDPLLVQPNELVRWNTAMCAALGAVEP